MKKNLITIASAVFVGSLLLTSCGKDGCTSKAATNYDADATKDDGSCILEDDGLPANGVLVTGNISANTTWTKDKVYYLDTRVAVLDGVTLTIEPGTVIKGKSGTGANATALVVARGAKLMAEGTASEPIIFTAESDQITSGQIESPNLSPDFDGAWGGLIVLGNAPISADAATIQIEGIPASDANGLYGGTDSTDNSGVIKYVSVRHGGANIGSGNEINGITFGGVGNGTTVEYVEVVANQDDGLEFFGGHVNAKNVVVWNNGDDALDTDQAWHGTIDNFVVVNPGDEAMELDGGEGTFNRLQTITNGTVYAKDAQGLVDVDVDANAAAVKNTMLDISNVYFTSLEDGQDFDDNGPNVTVSNLEATIPSGESIADYFTGGVDADVTDVAEGANTVGADLTKFNTWSWARVAGGF